MASGDGDFVNQLLPEAFVTVSVAGVGEWFVYGCHYWPAMLVVATLSES